jgi:hypothetical protein
VPVHPSDVVHSVRLSLLCRSRISDLAWRTGRATCAIAEISSVPPLLRINCRKNSYITHIDALLFTRFVFVIIAIAFIVGIHLQRKSEGRALQLRRIAGIALPLDEPQNAVSAPPSAIRLIGLYVGKILRSIAR